MINFTHACKFDLNIPLEMLKSVYHAAHVSEVCIGTIGGLICTTIEQDRGTFLFSCCAHCLFICVLH